MEQTRKLGATEYIYRKTAGVVEVTLQGEVDVSVLNKAINRVLIENPVFSCKIIKKGKNYWFQHDPGYRDILKTFTIDKDEEKTAFIEKSMARTTLCEEMVFQCAFFSCACSEYDTLLIPYNHAIADGASMIFFIQTLLSSYDAICNGDTTVNPPTISPPMEDYPQAPKKFKDFMAILKRELPVRLKKRARFPFHDTAPIESRQTRTIYKKVSSEVTAKYYKACRKSRTTVHGIVMAAMLFALARRLPDNTRPFSMTNNVNMRTLLHVPYEQMGIYVSMIDNLVSVTRDMEFWALAKSTRKNISVDSKNNLPAMSPVIYYPIHRIMPQKMNDKMINGPDMGRALNLTVANLGKMNAPGEFSGISVHNLISHVAIHHLGPDFGLVLMDTQGHFGFNLHYVWPLTTAATAQKIMDDFLQILKRCTEEETFFPLK